MPRNGCFLCEGFHFADECTTYPTLEERENAVETLELCMQCLRPTVADHVHNGLACNHCGKDHHRALCPLEPWRKGTTCAFCLGYHLSNDCDKYGRLKDRLRAVETLKICRRCLSRSHSEDDCASRQCCHGCKERHHFALCWKRKKPRHLHIDTLAPPHKGPSTAASLESRKDKDDSAEPDEADEIEGFQVDKGSKPTSNAEESSNEKTQKSSSSSECRTQVHEVKPEVNDDLRDLRLAKKAKRRAERERDSARKERDDAQGKCKALEKRIHGLEEENRNCEAIRQVTAAAVEASIEAVTNREEVRRRTIEKERDDATKKLLEAEMRIEALKKAASDAVRLTLEFQAWRIRALIKAKKGGIPQKTAKDNREDGPTLSEKVATTVQKTDKTELGTASNDNARKRPAASSAPLEKRRRTDCVKPPAEELNQKLDVVLGGYSEPVAEKYRLFFVENLRGIVTIEELVQFVRLRCPSDVDLANSIINSFITSL